MIIGKCRFCGEEIDFYGCNCDASQVNPDFDNEFWYDENGNVLIESALIEKIKELANE